MAGNINVKIQQDGITIGISLVKWVSGSLESKQDDRHDKLNGHKVSLEWDKLFHLQRIEYPKPKQQAQLNRKPQCGYRSDWENHYLQCQRIRILPRKSVLRHDAKPFDADAHYERNTCVSDDTPKIRNIKHSQKNHKRGMAYINNHDDLKNHYATKDDAEKAITWIKSQGFDDCDKFNSYYNAQRKFWFVGRSKYLKTE